MSRATLLRFAVRIALVVAAVLAVNQIFHVGLAWAVAGMARPTGLVLAGLVAVYCLLMALPFLPGLEVGVMLVLLNGVEVVPIVYGATVAGLLAAYAVGRTIPPATLERAFRRVGLAKAADLAAEIAPLDRAGRLALLQSRLPGRPGLRPMRLRHFLVAASFNLPGNAVIGGGGGICLMVGLSRLIGAPAMILTVVLGVAPAPLLIWTLGPETFLG